MSAFLHSLADVLGTTEAEARQALADFVATLHTRLDTEDEVTFEGLGTFRRAGGALTFEAAPAVALVVNHRYAGMEPIPLSSGTPPRWQTGLPDDQHPLGPPPESVFETAETAPDDADEPDLPPLFASDETLMALRDAARELDTPPSEEAAQWADEMIEEDSQIVPVDLSEPEEPTAEPPIAEPSVIEEVVFSDEPPPADEDDEEDEDDEDEDGPIEDDERMPVFPPHIELEHTEVDAVPPSPAPAEVPPPPPPAPERPPRARAPEPDAPRRTIWPFAVLAALVLVAAAVLLLRGFGRDEAPPPPVATRDTAAVAPVDTAAATTAPVDTTAAEPPPAPVEEGPLQGTAPVTPGSGYTIVVGGTSSNGAAERIAAPYREQGFRTGVIAGRTSTGASIYRVGVGQFGSLGEAQRALGSLRGTVPGDAWITRL